MLKVVHLTSAHHLLDSRIFYKECITLARFGYSVVLVAPHDKDELLQGVCIRSVRKPRNRADRITRIVWYVYRAALKENACLYHFHDPELIPVGLLLKLKGKRVVYDIHEDLPRQILTKPWIPALLRALIGKLAEVVEGIAGQIFDGIVAAEPLIHRRFSGFQTCLVQNFPILDTVQVESRPYQKREPLVVYVGVISNIRGAREMVEAIGLLRASTKARLVLAGSFSPPELMDSLEKIPGWERVNYVGWLPREAVNELLSKSRVGLVVLHPTPKYLQAQPTKLFDYMSAALPVVASNFPLWRRFVGNGRCGFLIDPLDPKAIAQAITWILENPEEAEATGRLGQKAVISHYNWATEAKELLTLYEKVLQRCSPWSS